MSREWIVAGIIAVLFHGLLLFGFRLESAAVPLPVSDTAVDVSLEGAESGSAAAPAAPATPEPPTPPPPVEPPPPPVPPPPPEPTPTPETPPPVTTAEPAQVMPPTPAPAERPVHRLPPRPAHPSQTASKAIGGAAVGAAPEGHSGTAATGAKGSGASAIRARSNPKPPYPSEAERLHQQGRVILEVQVGTDGRALSVSVKRSSGFPILDNAAVQAVERWTFEPARVAGLPVAGRADVPVNFALGQ